MFMAESLILIRKISIVSGNTELLMDSEQGYMSGDTKKHGKRKYLDSYVRSLSGDYEYTGSYFKFDMPEEILKRVKIALAVLTVSVAVLFVFAGMLNSAGSRVLYVILPYAVLLLPILFMLSDVYKIAVNKKPMTRKQYDHSVLQLKRSTLAIIIFSAMSAVGDIVYILFFCSPVDLFGELIYLAACLCILVISIALLSIQRKIKCIECN
jgi:hypothetical protein